jgi:hypothetical protein
VALSYVKLFQTKACICPFITGEELHVLKLLAIKCVTLSIR